MLIHYHLRSLTKRPTRTALTVVSIALAVFVSISMLSLVRGLVSSLEATGHPLNLVVLTRGAETLEFSSVDRRVFEILRQNQYIAVDGDTALASPEFYYTSLLEAERGDAPPAQAIIRGVLPVALAVHHQVKLTEGRFPETSGEIMAGSLAATRTGLPRNSLQIGDTVRFDGNEWLIVGRFAAPGTAFDSEIWAPLDDVMLSSRRDELSGIVVRARDAAAVDEFLFDLQLRADLLVYARAETDYYAGFAAAYRPVQAMVWAMAGLLTVGGIFIGMNTFLASITGRIREVGVLRTLGFRRPAILGGFVLESLIPALAGGVIACLAAWGLDGFALRVPMGAFRLQFDLTVAATGMLLSVLIALGGGAWPLWRAARIRTVDAIRHR
ncbi:MAG: ABC transporter permease [Opitutales bacterium]|nr:ABC transporter permease [Opitutales bacterium]